VRSKDRPAKSKAGEVVIGATVDIADVLEEASLTVPGCAMIISHDR